MGAAQERVGDAGRALVRRVCRATAVCLAALGPGVAGQPAGPPTGPADVRRLVLAGPDTIVELKDVGRGVPTRLAWSPDGTRIYVRLSVFDRWANETVSFLLATLPAREVAPLAAEPAWAPQYWAWKSAAASPADPGFRIKLETREDLVRTTNVGREGNIGQNVSDPTATLDEVVVNAARATQKVRFETLWLRGHAIDRAVNRAVTPGRTFGWAPAPRALVAYADEKGRLTLMDATGRTRRVGGAKHLLLPAWSGDGTRVAFLQKAGDGFALRMLDVRPE